MPRTEAPDALHGCYGKGPSSLSSPKFSVRSQPAKQPELPPRGQFQIATCDRRQRGHARWKAAAAGPQGPRDRYAGSCAFGARRRAATCLPPKQTPAIRHRGRLWASLCRTVSSPFGNHIVGTLLLYLLAKPRHAPHSFPPWALGHRRQYAVTCGAAQPPPGTAAAAGRGAVRRARTRPGRLSSRPCRQTCRRSRAVPDARREPGRHHRPISADVLDMTDCPGKDAGDCLASCQPSATGCRGTGSRCCMRVAAATTPDQRAITSAPLNATFWPLFAAKLAPRAPSVMLHRF